MTDGRKPLIVMTTSNDQVLEQNCYEYAALKQVETQSPQLQSDGIARKEVRQRLAIARRQLDHALHHAFDPSVSEVNCCYQNQIVRLTHSVSLNSHLSKICDDVYHDGLRLWNELINRSELTSQGVKASRNLITAMIEHETRETLGLAGYGPERSMYESVLKNTGIHRPAEEEWEFAPPHENSGVFHVWKAMEAFCLSAAHTPRSLESLYDLLVKNSNRFYG